MIYNKYLTSLAKTDPPITLFEHSSNVLQILNYLCNQNANQVTNVHLLRAGALTHDIGKLEQDIRQGQWFHTCHSKNYLHKLLSDTEFQSLLNLAGIDCHAIDKELLLMLCEQHHHPSVKLLMKYKEAILVSIADVLASAIETGIVGSIQEILKSSSYTQISLELTKSLGFDQGFDNEIHRIDLPNRFIEDVFLANMIYQVLSKKMQVAGVIPLLQKEASLWVVGNKDQTYKLIENFTVNPHELFEHEGMFNETIYGTILNGIPAVGSMQADSLKYLLVNETIALRFARLLFQRKTLRKLFEKYELSHLLGDFGLLAIDSLRDLINSLWLEVRSKLLQIIPQLFLPENVTSGVECVLKSQVDRLSIALVSPNKKVLEKVKIQDKKLAEDVEEFLALFDASRNGYRSITNILLEFNKMKLEISKGEYNLQLKEVALIDGKPLKSTKLIGNSALCPICQRFKNKTTAYALITGNPKTDSGFQTYRSSRAQMKICQWCFFAGYVDLPIAKISSEGKSIGKEREYLYINSPLNKNQIQRIMDYGRIDRSEEIDEAIDEKDELPQENVDFSDFGIDDDTDELPILGMNRKRLSQIKAFVLPTINSIGNLVGINVPFRVLVGEDGISGAVRRELAKAAMYDFWRYTKASSIHYKTISNDAPFSVSGTVVSLEEMKRASIAYQIVNRHGRYGRYRQLNTHLFMLMLTHPRQALTTILRKKRREESGKYAPGEERIKELIEMTESIAQHDWKFELGLRVVEMLVEVKLAPKARGFYRPDRRPYTGVDLVKWIQRMKMIKDENSARAWGTMLINALKRGDLAHKDYIRQKGGEIKPPGVETIQKVIDTVEDIIATSKKFNYKLNELSRDLAEMDYYLLFYYNQKNKVKEAEDNE